MLAIPSSSSSSSAFCPKRKKQGGGVVSSNTTFGDDIPKSDFDDDDDDDDERSTQSSLNASSQSLVKVELVFNTMRRRDTTTKDAEQFRVSFSSLSLSLSRVSFESFRLHTLSIKP
jgi:hypothetical protein